MESRCPFEQDLLVAESDTSSSISLVEQGLNSIQQGYYTEGAAFFRLARERLSPDQLQLTAALDAVNHATATYLHAQQMLHEASKCFTESSIEQQAQIAALRKLLPTLMEDTDMGSLARVQPRESAKVHQSLQGLQLPHPAAEDSGERQSFPSETGNALPALYVTCFGRFEVRRFSPLDPPIELCRNLKGQALLRYLIAHPKHRETVDTLMAVLWPEERAEAARHKLRVAMSALRCSLNKHVVDEPGGGYILCQDQTYQLNPSVALQSDVDEFLALYQAGQQARDGEARVAHYEKACNLYTGPFLVEDLYADWPCTRREELSKTYMAMCSQLAEFHLERNCYETAATWASAILKVDRCDEEAHRQLIRAYAAAGRRTKALRQYQECQRILAEELGVQPMPETQNLFHMLLNGEDAPTRERR